MLDITSDAGVEAYEGWGGYGAGKAALEHLGAVLAVEFPALTVWSVDPGDLRTVMHQAAFPGEDISDRPEPAAVVPAFLDLIGSDRPERPLPGRRARLERSSGMTALTAPVPAPTSTPTSTSMAGGSGVRRLPELHPLSFSLPPELEAPSPPEYRGMTRDSVRMLVATRSDGALVHSNFSELPRFLDEGDLVVINTSGHAGGRARRHSARRLARPGPPLDAAAGRAVDRRGPPGRPARFSARRPAM